MADRSHLPIHDLVVREALDFLGVHEVGGENRGPTVDWFLAAAELGPGYPWCAAFVNRTAEIACAKKNISSPLELVPFQAYVQSYYETADGRGWLRPPGEKPRHGDLFMIWHRGKQRYAHIGWVKNPDAMGDRFDTVEGNSNDEGSREGYEVCSNPRPYSDGIRFANPWGDG